MVHEDSISNEEGNKRSRSQSIYCVRATLNTEKEQHTTERFIIWQHPSLTPEQGVYQNVINVEVNLNALFNIF